MKILRISYFLVMLLFGIFGTLMLPIYFPQIDNNIFLYSVGEIVLMCFLLSILTEAIVRGEVKKSVRQESIFVKPLQDAPLGKYIFLESLQMKNGKYLSILTQKEKGKLVCLSMTEEEFSNFLKENIQEGDLVEHIRVDQIESHENDDKIKKGWSELVRISKKETTLPPDVIT